MMCNNKNQLGLALGGLFVVIHAVWALIVATGYGQALLDWIFGLHMISTGFAVMPFSMTKTLILLVVAFVAGYVLGWILSAIWNWAGCTCMGKKRRR